METLKAIRNVAFIPFMLLLLPFILLGVAIVVAIALPRSILLHRRWKSSLHRQGRHRKFSSTEMLGGALIVDSPTLGWNVKYCWWTPGDLRALSPFPIPADAAREDHMRADTGKLQMDFDDWCFENYLSVDTGSAILLATRRGDQLARELTQNVANISSIVTWSGPCVAESDANDAG